MDDRRLEDAQKQIVPEPFDLHVLLGEQPQIEEHIKPDGPLDCVSGVFDLMGVEENSQGKAGSDVRKV